MSIQVSKIKEFIRSLQAVKDKLSGYDLKYLTSLEEKFDYAFKTQPNSQLSTELEADQLTWIEQLFLTRWENLSKEIDIHSSYIAGVHWISLARGLASFTAKPYSIIFKPLISSIKLFIESLVVIKEELSESDLNLLNMVQDNFLEGFLNFENDQLFHTMLSETDYLAWIEELFAKRWQKVADSYDDYTFNTNGVNAAWINFAKDLEPKLQKPYLLLLIPTLTNNNYPRNFVRLNRISDPRSIFLANNNSWHRLKSLYVSGVFGIGGKHKAGKLKPLSLNELNRIRSKRGTDLAFTANNGHGYFSFWDYIKKEIAPAWQNNGACSTYFLPALLGIIEEHLELTNERAFQNSFKEFSNYLASCFIDEVNNFYGACIQVQNENYFLVEILLDWMQEDKSGLDEKLINVARWICNIDPSLVSKKEVLRTAYEGLRVGINFNLLFLKQLIVDLNIDDTNVVKDLHTELLSLLELQIKTGNNDNAELVATIKKLYALRWGLIIDTILDYTRHIKNSVNHPWIRLAQFLAGANYVEPNYYKLLIPTLRYDYDRVTKELLTTYPLSRYIISTTNELIYLPNCINHYKSYGTFYNCNYHEPRPFTNMEKARLAHADPEIYSYFRRIEEIIDDPPISKQTWNEIRKLVNGSLFVEGLTNHEIGKESYIIATDSYDKFAIYINELPVEEKQRFYRHSILLRSRKVSVQEILDLLQTPQYNWRVCMVGQAEYFLKLLIDYAPTMKVSEVIEQKSNVAGMRAHSARKVYSDYDSLTEEDATKRILIIITSLMTHSFQCLLLTGNWVSIDDHSNKVTDTGKEIFGLIQKYLDKGNFQEARFLYAQIIEHVVKPAVANHTWVRYQDTHEWLVSIQNGSIFTNANEGIFDPELLLIVLWSLVKENCSHKIMIEKFLDELHDLLISSDNKYKKWIKINIKFVQLINNKELDKSKILQSLQSAEHCVFDPELVLETSKEFMIHRLSQLILDHHNDKVGGFFGNFPGQHKKIYDFLNARISKKLAESKTVDNNEISWLPNLLPNLELILESTKGKDLGNIEHYLNKITQKEEISNPILSF